MRVSTDLDIHDAVVRLGELLQRSGVELELRVHHVLQRLLKHAPLGCLKLRVLLRVVLGDFLKLRVQGGRETEQCTMDTVKLEPRQVEGSRLSRTWAAAFSASTEAVCLFSSEFALVTALLRFATFSLPSQGHVIELGGGRCEWTGEGSTFSCDNLRTIPASRNLERTRR